MIAARVAVAAGHHKYSPLCEDASLESLAQFYSETSDGRVFSPKEVNCHTTRVAAAAAAAGTLAWPKMNSLRESEEHLKISANGLVLVPMASCLHPSPRARPTQVMVLGMRAKGALPWMLDFVGNGPMFVPRPTYNPNPSAGLYHSRQVLSFDVTGPHRYLPMIQALKRHKVRSVLGRLSSCCSGTPSQGLQFPIRTVVVF